jgi:DNA-binding transcriptional regulator YiaG
MTEEIEKLKELRERFGLPRNYLAYKLGCAEFTLIRWEQGISKPSPIYRRQLQKLISKFPGKDKGNGQGR